jgi:hypothetical protein
MKKLLYVIALLTVLLVVVSPVYAAQEQPPGVPDFVWQALVSVGLGTLIMTITEILKRLGVLPDGSAGVATVILCAIGYIVLRVLGMYGIDLGEGTAQVIIEALTALGELALSIISAIYTYKTARIAQVLKPLPGRS